MDECLLLFGVHSSVGSEVFQSHMWRSRSCDNDQLICTPAKCQNFPTHPSTFYVMIHSIFNTVRRFSAPFHERSRWDVSDKLRLVGGAVVGTDGKHKKHIHSSYHTLKACVTICMLLFLKCLKVMASPSHSVLGLGGSYVRNDKSFDCLLWIAMFHKGITLTIWRSGDFRDVVFGAILNLTSCFSFRSALGWPRDNSQRQNIITRPGTNGAESKDFLLKKINNSCSFVVSSLFLLSGIFSTFKPIFVSRSYLIFLSPSACRLRKRAA